MNCLRCGRETQDDHAFCDSCLKTMKEYPVRPGTAVALPKRNENQPIKKTKRRLQPAPQDQIRKLKRQRLMLWILVILLTLSLIGTLSFEIYRHFDRTPKTGQNYAVAETTAPAP